MYQAQKYLKDDVIRIESNIEKNREEINNILEIQDSDNILPTINQFLDKRNFKPIASIKELEECINKLYEMSKLSDNELLIALKDILRIIKEMFSLMVEIDYEFVDAENQKKVIECHDQSELPIMEILKNSLKIIDKDLKIVRYVKMKLKVKNFLKKLMDV